MLLLVINPKILRAIKKLMAEDWDINKIIEDNLTSKNYTFHTISIKTTKVINEKKPSNLY